MTKPELLRLLNAIEFPRRYWELCDRFPIRPVSVGQAGRKEDILQAFQDLGIKPCYDSRDRSFSCEKEQIGSSVWWGVFCKQRSGVELLFCGKFENTPIGSNFAVLSYDARRLADSSFERSQFSDPPPYPRPNHNGDPAALKAIVKEFVFLVRMIKDAIRSKTAG